MFCKPDKRIEILNNCLIRQAGSIKEILEVNENLIRDIKEIKEDSIQNSSDLNTRIRNLNNLIDEKIDIERERFEGLLIVLEKEINNKINQLSDKPVVIDLLKKIAVLEAVKDGIEYRRSTVELLERFKSLNEEYLRLDREEKDSSKVLAQVDLLKWVLGGI